MTFKPLTRDELEALHDSNPEEFHQRLEMFAAGNYNLNRHTVEEVIEQMLDDAASGETTTLTRRATDRAELEAKQYFADQPEYHCSSCGRNAPPDSPCLMCLEASNGLLPGSLVDAARMNFKPTAVDFVGVGLVVLGFVFAVLASGLSGVQ